MKVRRSNAKAMWNQSGVQVVASNMKRINTRMFLWGNLCPMVKTTSTHTHTLALALGGLPATKASLKLHCWNLPPAAMAAPDPLWRSTNKLIQSRAVLIIPTNFPGIREKVMSIPTQFLTPEPLWLHLLPSVWILDADSPTHVPWSGNNAVYKSSLLANKGNP